MFEIRYLSDITNNLDNMRKPLNAQERAAIQKKNLYPYCGANAVLEYVDEYLFNEKILCIAEDGGSWGYGQKCTYIMNEPCWVNNHAHVLTAKENVSLEYLSLYLNFTDLNRFITGTTRGKLTKGALEKIQILLPTYEIQIQIVDLLQNVEKIIRQRQSQIVALDELTQSLFLEMFGDPIYNTKNWNEVCFGDVISVLTDYHANGSYQVLKNHVELLDEENYALMIRTTDLEHQNYTEDVKYITEEAYNFLTKTQVFGGEIIINKIGSAGKVYIMPNLNKPVSLGMNQFMIRVNSKANNQFIYYLLNTKAGQILIQNRVQGAVTKSITKDAVRSIPIILPPIDLQNEFDNKLEQINSHKNLLQNSLQSMQELYQSLLQKAFKGELFQGQA